MNIEMLLKEFKNIRAHEERAKNFYDHYIDQVDDDIDEKEKEYIRMLLNSFDLPEEKLEEFVAFAENPDDRAVRDMMAFFPERDIKYVFMFDCLMLAYCDEEFHEKEKAIIDQYFEGLKLTDREKEQILYLHEKIKEQDKRAVYRFFLQKDAIKKELYEYLLDYYDMRIASIEEEIVDEIKRAMKFEMLEWSYSEYHYHYSHQHRIIEVSTAPINNYQFLLFLQWLSDNHSLLFEGDLVMNSDRSPICNLNVIKFENGSFILKENEKYMPVSFISPYSTSLFFEWLNNILGSNYHIPVLCGKELIRIENICAKKEIFLTSDNNKSYFFFEDPQEHARATGVTVTNDAIGDLTFRLMSGEERRINKFK